MEENGDLINKLELLNNPRKSAGEGICPVCSVKNNEMAIKNRQLIKQVNAQANIIEDLVSEIEMIRNMLAEYREKHVKKK